MRPIFACVEGPDGAGKGVQARELYFALVRAGYDAHLHSEPTAGDIGQLIRRVLRHEIEMPAQSLRLLFAADRMEHSQTIAALLASGVSVVCDRYDLSNLAQAWAEEPSLEALDWTASLHRGCVVPDLTIVLQAPLDVCIARIAARGKADIYETREMQKKVHAAYGCAHSLLGRPVSYVDATGTPDEVAERVWAVVKEAM